MTTEIHNRAEAHRRLIALGMPADLAADCLDHEQVRYANASNYPGAWPILAAYRRHCAAHEGIVERAIRLDREATARACGPDLTPAEDPLDTVPPEERERIVAVAQKAAEHAWRFAGDSAKEPEYCAAIAREVAAYHTRTGGPEFQPGYHHPDPVIDQEVRLDLADGRAIDKAAGIREGWHRGWTVDGLRSVVADKAAQVSEDVIGQALTSPGREDERAEAVRRAFESALTDDPTMLSRAWQAVTFAADVTRETYPSSPARRRLVEDELRRAPADRTPLFWPADSEARLEAIVHDCGDATCSRRGRVFESPPCKRAAAMGEGLGPEPGILAPAATAPADASLEARAKALGRDIIDKLGPLAPAPPRYFRDTCIALVRAVDASRQGLTEDREAVIAVNDALDISDADDAEHLIECHAATLPDVVRRWSRAILATQEVLSRRIGDMVEPPRPAPDAVTISRAILEKLAKAAASDSDAREARWAAERILQRATLAAERARTDPLHARVLAEATQIDARLTEPIPDSIGPRGSSYDGAHAPARVLCPTCERWHFPTDCCQA